ncbi:hypothetical protein HHK36_014030 [Tetracentron sinense]|uniref:EGF-like domain-containing protein n=1 Tax=Tetracentron sinense TaxID=13715 RepID=A0A834Z5B3_TETSI|nr:hypothetical protein HHK36_014030 [Tetracentron sinense]
MWCSNNMAFLLLFLFFIGGLRANFLPSMPDSLTDIGCALVNCGKGTCEASNGTLLGFDCKCNPGWKKIQIGPLSFPSCIVPNCTLDFECGSETPPPPPPPVPSFLPPLNFSEPCGLTWCGDGTCVANGTGSICKCNEGSANLMDLPDLACFKQCYFGADCNGLGFGQNALPPTSPNTSDSTRNGASEVLKFSCRQHALTILLVVAIFTSCV